MSVSTEADIVERLMEERKRLDRRIHNQRRQLRETWQIVEQRRKWLGSDTARKHCQILSRWLKDARAEVAILKDILLNPDPGSEPDNIRLHREKCDALDALREANSEITKLCAERDAAANQVAVLQEVNADLLAAAQLETEKADAAARDMRERCLAVLERRHKTLVSNADNAKHTEEQREIWAELANEKLDDMRAIRKLPDTPAFIATHRATPSEGQS